MPPRIPLPPARRRVLFGVLHPRLLSTSALHRLPTPTFLPTKRCFATPTLLRRPHPPTLFTPQARHASILGSLSDNPTAYNKRIRRGRGPSSGKGKTSGRGHKGQKQHGKVPVRFQGGQTPLEIVKGKRGAVNVFALDIAPINLNRIQSWIDQGRLDPSQPITVRELAKSRCLHGVKDGVKLLARGKEELKTPINILVSRASAAAIEAVEAAGGKVTTRYYTKQSIRRLLNGTSESSFFPLGYKGEQEGEHDEEKPFSYRLPDPTGRKDIEYYRDSAHRGYLSHMVEEGHGPSLFYRTPGTKSVRKKRADASGASVVKGENRIW